LPSRVTRITAYGSVLLPYAGRSERHHWHRDSDRVRSLAEQPPDLAHRNVSFDDIAFDHCGVTRAVAGRQPQLLALRRIAGLVALNDKTIAFEVGDPVFAALARVRTPDLDHGLVGSHRPSAEQGSEQEKRKDTAAFGIRNGSSDVMLSAVEAR
jgi:hypothetical protein